MSELERRYSGPQRSVSPSPESAEAVRVEGPWGKVSLRPQRLRGYIPWLIAAASFFGITGSSIAGYYASFRAGHAEQAALEAKQRELEDQLATLRAVQASQAKRLKTLESAQTGALVVTGP